MIARVSDSRAAVLITGESGTGKELVARAIHNHGTRSTERFVAVNCGALTEILGINRKTLYRMAARFAIEFSHIRDSASSADYTDSIKASA